MPKITIAVRERDVRRIKISCRCGEVSIAEIPKQIARGLNLHPCPKCQHGYAITQLPDGKWQVTRMEATVADMEFMDDEAPVSKKKTWTM